ncbi:discoidin domain-containing protein [Streptomyces sp. NPDC048200]|uniref:discoidin domain-containing protein n=1 Tax=Streptomyces sp. NPDC048200 TaxID=3365512 RepID=UPI0037109100
MAVVSVSCFTGLTAPPAHASAPTERPALSTSLGTSSGSFADATDDSATTSWMSDRAPTTDDWIKIDRGAALPLPTVALSMTSLFHGSARISNGIVEISNDNSTWHMVGSFSDTSEVRLSTPPRTRARWVRVRPTVNQTHPLVLRDFLGIVRQPAQPTSGPGGSDYTHDYRVTAGGSGSNAWYVFEPTNPAPASAPVTVITHGYGDYSGYKMHEELIKHTVRKGSIVIYPRWQTSLITPCVGPLDATPCRNAALAGIRGALDYLKADPSRVQPDLDKATYFGHSFGGIITANLVNRWQSLGLPKPRAVFLDEPTDAGGGTEPTLDASLTGIPATTKFVCFLGQDGVISESGKAGASCNTIFPLLTQIPAQNKNLVLAYTDNHGTPGLSSAHGVSQGGPNAAVDALDYNLIWRQWDALRHAALDGTDTDIALGDTPEHRFLGYWSDGTPIREPKIQNTAPIAP